MTYALGFTRLLLFAIIVGAYVFIFPLLSLFIPKNKKERFGLTYRGLIAKTLFPALGIKVHKKGHAPEGPALIVSNHRSYVDPAPVAAYCPILPIAKMEMGNWPLLGIGVKLTGILLVKRDNKESRSNIIIEMKKAWARDQIVLNYPEGTTHDSPQTLPFLKGAFLAATSRHVPIIPLCIEYGLKSDAWIGDDTFIPHFIRCFGKWRTDIYLAFGEPILNDDYNEAVRQSRSWIDTSLSHYQELIND